MTRFAPARFILFIVLLVIGAPLGWFLWQPLKGIMAGFDLAAFIFLVSCLPLLNDKTAEMRRHTKENDANRALLLGVTVAVSSVIFVCVGAVIIKSKSLQMVDGVMILGTLALAWLFGNIVYALHYAHAYYSADEEGSDSEGIDFPGKSEPDYWDFIYFSFTLGMTFQTSDTDIT